MWGEDAGWDWGESCNFTAIVTVLSLIASNRCKSQ